MKIKNKLTFYYTIVVGLIFLIIDIYIYFLTSTTIKKNFFSSLKERAGITAMVFLEQDEQRASVIKPFQKKYLVELPNEVIRIYNEKNEPVFIDSSDIFTFSESMINEIRKQKNIEISLNNRQVFGEYYNDNQGDFVIIASAIDENGKKTLVQLAYILFSGLILSVIIVYLSGHYITKIILDPVVKIVQRTKQISQTNLHLRLDEGNKKDELAELSMTINDMLMRLERAFQQQRSFIASASHEIRTPLTTIIGNADIALSKNRSEEEYKATLKTIQTEAERLHKLSDGLLNIAQADFDHDTLQKKSFRMDELLEEIEDQMRQQLPNSSFSFIIKNLPEMPDELLINGNKYLLQIAFENLIENASKFSKGQPVDVQLIRTKNTFQIQITDTGMGIPQGEIELVKQTFYRAENARGIEGSGIGLALCAKIIELHHGTMTIQSKLNNGTTIHVELPLN
jgi:signal transduction histidine kinase